MPKPNTEEARSFSKYDGHKLRRLYTQVIGAFGSVQNFVIASSFPVSKLRKFFHSKHSYTKFTFTTRKFKRIKAFVGFKNGTLCMDLTYVDKLAKNDEGVKYLPVRQYLFDRTVVEKRMKTKDSK